MSEADIWQVIQTGNDISVARIQLFVSITIGVLIVSSLQAIRLNIGLLCIMLGTYLVYGYVNFFSIIAEMEILESGIRQLSDMRAAGQELSYMGTWLGGVLDDPLAPPTIPILHFSHWVISFSTVAYSIQQYRRQRAAGA